MVSPNHTFLFIVDTVGVEPQTNLDQSRTFLELLQTVNQSERAAGPREQPQLLDRCLGAAGSRVSSYLQEAGCFVSMCPQSSWV